MPALLTISCLTPLAKAERVNFLLFLAAEEEGKKSGETLKNFKVSKQIFFFWKSID